MWWWIATVGFSICLAVLICWGEEIEAALDR